MPDERLLTDAELMLMKILWSEGPSTVREVMAEMPDGRAPAYTTVSTTLRILEQKGFVESHKEGRSHRYGPTLRREGYEKRQLRSLIGGLFEGSALSLVRRLIDGGQVSKGELAEMQQLLDEATSPAPAPAPATPPGEE